MPPPLTDDLGMALAIFGEMSVGFLFGLVITYIMTGAQTAGGIIGGQIGFGLGGLFDPEFSESTDALPQLFQLFSLAIFLALDGPGRLLEAVRVSFDRFPPGTVEPSLRAVGMLIAAFSGIFLAALKLVGPLLAGLLVMNVAMGSVARAVPSLNLFVMDIPVKVLVGVGGLIILLPGFASVFSELLEQGWKDIARVMAFL
jgi:flagellar biosynthetic protein FliR